MGLTATLLFVILLRVCSVLCNILIARTFPEEVSFIFMATDNNADTKEGVVVEALPNTLFRVELDSGEEVLAYLSGKMRINRIRILVGDRVSLKLPEGADRGRIVYRYK